MAESVEQAKVQPLIFGRYCLLERLNAGGMAEIFRARPFFPAEPHRYLVMKRILPHLADDTDFITMFVDEARITTQLSHPNICQLYELGLLDGTYYIVMEYIAGRDILALINWYRRRRSFLPPSQVAFIVAEICAGLDYAHAKKDSRGAPLGVVHRDISPQNVLLGYDGSVKVIDFGIARASVRRQRTEVGVLKGKFGYMSPEQVRGDDIDQRSDVFATGILLWEMLTARRLFYSKNEYEIIERVRGMDVPAPSSINPQIPPELDYIVARALERDLDLRYQSAGEMEADLREWLGTIRPPYSRRALAAWMQSTYAEEIARERVLDELFAPFIRPRDVALYLEETGQPLPELLSGRSALDMTGAELTRLDTELTRGAEQVLVASKNDPVPRMTKIGAPSRRGSYAHRGFVAVTISIGVLLAVFAVVFSFASGTSLGTKGRTATMDVSVDQATGAILYVDDLLVAPTHDDGVVRTWRFDRLNPGHHTLRVLAEGYEEVVEQVLVQGGQNVQIAFELDEVPPEILDVSLTLSQEYPGLRIAVNGRDVAPDEPLVFPLRIDDKVLIDAAAPGYFPESLVLRRDGKITEYVLELRELRTQLALSTDRVSTIRVNGQAVGGSTERVTIDDLSPFDAHRIDVRPDEPGFQPFTMDFVFDGAFQRHVHAQPVRIGQRQPDGTKVGVLQLIGNTFYLVEIDGRSAGFATGMGVRRLAISAGPHEVTLRIGEQESVFSVDVQPGRVETIRVPERAHH